LSESQTLLAGSLSESLRRLIRSHLAEAPGGSDALLKLAGKVIAFHLKPFDRWLYLCPTQEDVQILTEISGEPDVIFHGTLAAFVQVSLHPGDTGAVRNSGLVIDGDMALAEDFQALSAALGIDWQRFLSRYLGYQLAGSTLDVLRSGRNWLKKAPKPWRAISANTSGKKPAGFPTVLKPTRTSMPSIPFAPISIVSRPGLLDWKPGSDREPPPHQNPKADALWNLKPSSPYPSSPQPSRSG